MSAPKWTPGPWKVDGTECTRKDSTYCEIVSDSDSCWIAQVQSHKNCIATPPGWQNAHLIAAVTDLYAALDQTKDVIDFILLAVEMPPKRRAAFEQLGAQAAAALAKARGEA